MIKPYYEHAGITIYHGDCREVLPTIPRAEAVVTDPPYGISWKRGLNEASNTRSHAGIQNDQDTSARDAILDAVGDVPAVVFGSFYAPFPRNLKQVLVWHKPSDAGLYGSVTGFRRDAEPIFLCGKFPIRTVEKSSVIRSSRMGISAVAAETGHPHTKPTDIIQGLLEMLPDGIVLDPFMGSGTTLVAAKNLGRKAIGIELEERYCEIAAQRLSQEVLAFA